MDEIIKKAYLSRLEDCLPVDFSDGVKFGVGLCKDKKYTEEDMIGFLNWSLGMEVVEMICNNKSKQEIFQRYINSLNKQD